MNKKVLIVDDDTNLVDSLRRRLGGWFAISTAHSAEEGLAVLKDKGPFAVVVSDQRMGDMDGIEFLAEVRKSAPDTVRIMMTGEDEKIAIAAINEAGAYRFITKPCGINDLASAIEDGIVQHRVDTYNSVLVRPAFSFQ